MQIAVSIIAALIAVVPLLAIGTDTRSSSEVKGRTSADYTIVTNFEVVSAPEATRAMDPFSGSQGKMGKLQQHNLPRRPLQDDGFSESSSAETASSSSSDNHHHHHSEESKVSGGSQSSSETIPPTPVPTAPPVGPDFSWSGGDGETSLELSPRFTFFAFGRTLLGGYNATLNARRCPDFYSVPGDPYACDVEKMPQSSVGILDHQTKEMKYFWGPDGHSFFQPPLNVMPPSSTGYAFLVTATTPIYEDGDQFCVFGAFVYDKATGHSENNATSGTYVVCLSGARSNPTQPGQWEQRWAKFPGTGYNATIKGTFEFRTSCYTLPPLEDQSAGAAVLQDAGAQQEKDAEDRAAALTTPPASNTSTSRVFIFGTYSKTSGGLKQQILVQVQWSSLLDLSFKDLSVWNGSGYSIVAKKKEPAGEGGGVESWAADYLRKKPLWEEGGTPNLPVTTSGFTLVRSTVLEAYFIFILPTPTTTGDLFYARTTGGLMSLEGPWSTLTPLHASVQAPSSYFASGNLWGQLLKNVLGTSDPSQGAVTCYDGKIHPSLAAAGGGPASAGAFSPTEDQYPSARPAGIVSRELWMLSYVCSPIRPATGNPYFRATKQLYTYQYASLYVPYFSFLIISKEQKEVHPSTAPHTPNPQDRKGSGGGSGKKGPNKGDGGNTGQVVTLVLSCLLGLVLVTVIVGAVAVKTNMCKPRRATYQEIEDDAPELGRGFF